MAEDAPTGERASVPASFDFDEESISALLDTFVEQQTGPQTKRSSRPADPNDAGAQAAHRTVFEHAPRTEALPLVGAGERAKRRRVELLRALADRTTGSSRAHLLTAEAEILEQLGDDGAACDSYREAFSADARNVVALRALRHQAIMRGDFAEAADRASAEALLGLTPTERASALKLLAQLHVERTGDYASAERAAEQARELVPDDFAAHLLLATIRLQRDDPAGAGESIAAAASVWQEVPAQAILLQHAGALVERSGNVARARELFEQASRVDPTSVTTGLGRVRTSLESLDHEGGLRALLDMAASTNDADLRRALDRTAATLAHHLVHRPDQAIAQLAAHDDVASKWTEVEVCLLRDDTAGALAALEIEPPGSTPEARAVGRARALRLRAELSADRVLQPEEALEVASIGLEHYLRAVGRWSSPEDEGEELHAVMEAMSVPPRNVVSDVLQADKSALLGDGAAFFAALERELSRADESLGPTLALAEVAESTGVSNRRRTLWRLKERGTPEPIVARALALCDREDGALAADHWLEEAAMTPGARGAFAATVASELSRRSGAGADTALEAALKGQIDYLPALWAVEECAEHPADRERGAVGQAMAETDASAWLRASCWASKDDDRIAHAKAGLDRDAPDPLLIETLVASCATDLEGAADLLALVPSGELSKLERRAAALRRARRFREAAELLREAQSSRPDDVALAVTAEEAALQAAEYARVAAASMQRARTAPDEDEELAALAMMAATDRLARGDMRGARLTLQSIAESRPDHLPTARALEWDALRERDTERIASSARRLLEQLPSEAAERAARVRLLVELWSADPDILVGDVDRLLRGIENDIGADFGLARKMLGMGYARRETETALHALTVMEAAYPTELERGAVAIERAHLLERAGQPERALETLGEAEAHPLALEMEAELLCASGRWEEAASRYQDAAVRAKDAQRSASLFRAAAIVLEERLDDDEAAIHAYVAAVDADITYPDVYRRLSALYHRQGRITEAEALTERRIEAGGDVPTLVALLIEQSRQRRARGDLQGVIASLHRCLKLDPQHFTALIELIEAHRTQQTWQGAAEGLIRVARLKRSVEEQIWAFSQLAELYHEQLADLPRAEGALRQVLKLQPGHPETLDRLASVLSAQGKPEQACKVLEELLARATDARAVEYRIRLALATEETGRTRQAELLLERLRAERRTDVDVILALADHFDRQGAPAAQAMHLNRAAADLREAIEERPDDESLWTALVRVLDRRHGEGPASCAASAAIALGAPPSLFSGSVTEDGRAFGEPRLPLVQEISRVVAPNELPEAALRLFSLCEPAFDKSIPFDSSAWKLRRVPATHRALVEEAKLVAQALGIGEPRVRMTHASGVACVPIGSDPPEVVVGSQLLERTTREQRVFLLARALEVARRGLAPLVRARREELGAWLTALLGGRETRRTRRQPSLGPEERRRKLIRAIPRRSRDEAESLVLELRGDPGFSVDSVPLAAAALGSRVALILTGDMPSAVGALLELSGQEVPGGVGERLGLIRTLPEAWELVRFAVDDAHFEARTQAGVDP